MCMHAASWPCNSQSQVLILAKNHIIYTNTFPPVDKSPVDSISFLPLALTLLNF